MSLDYTQPSEHYDLALTADVFLRIEPVNRNVSRLYCRTVTREVAMHSIMVMDDENNPVSASENSFFLVWYKSYRVYCQHRLILTIQSPRRQIMIAVQQTVGNLIHLD